MKISPRSGNPRPPAVHDDDDLVFQLPDLKLLRVIARSILLAAALLSFPFLRVVFHPEFLHNAAGAAADPKWVDDPFSLPMLIGDLKRQGLFAPGRNALFLGDPSSRRFFLKKNQIDPVTEFVKPAIGDRSIEFLLAADGLEDSSFGFVDRVVKVGGIVAVRLGSEPSRFFHLPSNYRVVYIRRYGSTVVGIKKIWLADGGGKRGRRLMSIAGSIRVEDPLLEPPREEERKFKRTEFLPETMGRDSLASKRVFVGLSVAGSKRVEDPLLEPPREEERKFKRTKFLPEAMGRDSLASYPKRVFVGLSADVIGWFEREYPKNLGGEFEIVRLELVEGGGVGGITEWMERNVREEDFVVMKAEADVVEEMVRGNVVGLVDELFLECDNQWGKKITATKTAKRKKSRRAFWECLTLYGRVRDEGVAVHQHQWWE